MGTKDWGKILSEYASRDCTQAEFCERHGIKKANLQYHRSRASKRHRASFVELDTSRISSPEVSPVLTVVEFPNGVKLSINV